MRIDSRKSGSANAAAVGRRSFGGKRKRCRRIFFSLHKTLFREREIYKILLCYEKHRISRTRPQKNVYRLSEPRNEVSFLSNSGQIWHLLHMKTVQQWMIKSCLITQELARVRALLPHFWGFTWGTASHGISCSRGWFGGLWSPFFWSTIIHVRFQILD